MKKSASGFIRGFAWVLLAGIAVGGQAGTDDWTGAVSSNASDPGNWSLGHVPAGSDAVRFRHESITGSRTITFDCVIDAGSNYMWSSAEYQPTETDLKCFNRTTGYKNPIIFEATDPTYGITQQKGSLRFGDNSNHNLALIIRGGKYYSAEEVRFASGGSTWVSFEEGTIQSGGDFVMANGNGAYAEVIVGSGDPSRHAVVTVPTTKWALLSANAGGTGKLTIKKGGEFHCAFLCSRSPNSTLTLDGGTFVKDGDVSNQSGFLFGYGEDHSQDATGRRILLTDNGGVLDLQASAAVGVPLELAEDATAATLTKRGPGTLLLASVGSGISIVVEAGGIAATSGTLASLTLAGGVSDSNTLPQHEGKINLRGGKIRLVVSDADLVDGTPFRFYNIADDLDLSPGLNALDQFVLGGSFRYNLQLVNDDGYVAVVPTEKSSASERVAYALYVGAANGDRADASNWVCYDLAMSVVPDEVPNPAKTTLLLTGSTAFQFPRGETAQWTNVVVSPLNGYAAVYGRYSRNRETKGYNGNNDGSYGMANSNWTEMRASAYAFCGERDLNNWAYDVNNAQVCVTGRFYVRPDQVGTWAIRQRYDDYYIFYVDGVQAVLNNTYNVDGAGSWEATAGWHDFKMIFGDTFGGEGATLTYNNIKTPMLITVPGMATAVTFEGGSIQLGNGANTITLTADCDWRGLGTLALPAGLSLDLAGHTLRIAGARGTFAGGVTITGGGHLIVDGETGDSFDSRGITVDTSVDMKISLPAAKAEWAGGGTAGDPLDPDNWNCKDRDGNVLTDCLPGLETEVTISGKTKFCLPAGTTLTCGKLCLYNIVLSRDTDWRGTLVSAPLPDGLDGVPLAYLDAPKGSAINTNVKPMGSKLRTLFDVTVQSANEYWFGAAQYTSDKWWYNGVYMFCNDGSSVYCGYAKQSVTFTPVVSNGRHLIEKDDSFNYVDGELKMQYATESPFEDFNITLFAQNRVGTLTPHGSQGTIRFHGCQMYKNDEFVRDFIPVRTASGVGAFDKCSKTFYPNVGTGTFIGGSELPTGTQTAFAVPSGISVDLNGYSLQLAAAEASSTQPTIGNSSVVPSTLTLDMTSDHHFGASRFTLSGGLTVVLNVASANYEKGTMILGLTGLPPNTVSFQLDPTTAARGVHLAVTDKGVYYDVDENAVWKATWTGNGTTTDATDPGNWTCINLLGNPVANGVPLADSEVTFEGRSLVKVAGATTWKAVTLTEDAMVEVQFADDFAADWDGTGVAIAVPFGVTLPEGKTVADIESYMRFTNVRYTPVLSADQTQILATPTKTLLHHHLRYSGTRSGMADTTFVSLPLSSYTTTVQSLLNLDGLIGASTAWQNSYLQRSQTRIDGWVFVREDQAGDWTVYAGYDDYSALAIDNEWVVRNPGYSSRVSGTCTVTPGWHVFTVIAGDTFGGFGANGYSINNFPLAVQIGDAGMVTFNSPNFRFEDPTAVTSGDFAPPPVGDINILTMEVAADCRVVFDPRTTQLKLHQAPTFNVGSKVALAPSFANQTEGRFTLLSWEEGEVTFPAGTTLTDLFDATSVGTDDYLLTIRDLGEEGYALTLTFHGTNFVERATWTGLAGTGDIANPGNWVCENPLGEILTGAVPHAGSVVTVSAATAVQMQVPAEAAPGWESLQLGAGFYLRGDLDWRGLSTTTIAQNFTIDLRGHQLKLGTVKTQAKLRITDSTDDAPGVLTLDIPDAETFENAAQLSVSGNIQLVKEGAGTYLMALAEQSYAGGTVVRDGLLTTPASGSSSATWSPKNGTVMGAVGSPIRLEGGTFDPKGNYDYSGFNLIAAGGTLANNGSDMTQTTWGGVNVSAFETNLVLTGSSTVLLNGGEMDLGGHTLTIDLPASKYIHIGLPKMMNGRVVATGGVRFSVQTTVDAPTVDFDLNAQLEFKNAIYAHDLTLRWAQPWGYNDATKISKVFGRFTPYTTYFPSIELQSGSTFDLSVRTEPFPTTAAEVSNVNNSGSFYITFAEGARVTLDLHGRTFYQNEETLVLAWDAKPANYDTLEFELDRETAKTCRFWTDEQGVWVKRREGLVFIFK